VVDELRLSAMMRYRNLESIVETTEEENRSWMCVRERNALIESAEETRIVQSSNRKPILISPVPHHHCKEIQLPEIETGTFQSRIHDQDFGVTEESTQIGRKTTIPTTAATAIATHRFLRPRQ